MESITQKDNELKQKVSAMKRESWIKNVMRIYPEKTRQETETLYEKIFSTPSPQ